MTKHDSAIAVATYFLLALSGCASISRPNALPSEAEMKEKWVSAGVQNWVRSNFARGKDARAHLDMYGKVIQNLSFNKTNNDQLYRPTLTLAYFCDHSGGKFQHQAGSAPTLGSVSDFMPRYPNFEYPGFSFSSLRIRQTADAHRQLLDANEHHAFGKFHCTRPDGSVQWVATVAIPETFMKADFFTFGNDPLGNWTIPVIISANETQFDRPQAYSTSHLQVMADRAARAGTRHKEQYGQIIFEAWPLTDYDHYGCMRVASNVRQGDMVLNSSVYSICKD
jgi:hypothetical protein